MTPLDALIELFDRFAALQGNKILVSEAEISSWPRVAFAAMKKQGLLSKAQSAKSAVCPGCERDCVTPVHCLPDGDKPPELFVLCDKRSDTNRVMIDAKHLRQWQCNAEMVCRFVAEALGLRRSEQASEMANRWNIGVAMGKKRSQMLCLQVDDFCMLVAGGNAIPLADFISFDNEVYSLDAGIIGKLVDAANTADERYTRSNAKREVGKLETQAMYESWQKACRKLKRENPNLKDTEIARKIAKMDIAKGRNWDTIRTHMVK